MIPFSVVHEMPIGKMEFISTWGLVPVQFMVPANEHKSADYQLPTSNISPAGGKGSIGHGMLIEIVNPPVRG